MKFVVVWNSTLEVCSGFYESDIPDYGRFGGPMGSVTETTHLELPEGLDPQCIMAVRDPETGEITLVEDPVKVQARFDTAWASLRAERNSRLAACDWVGMVDANLPHDQKDAWFAYRQKLRDLPGLVTDPTAAVPWPVYSLGP